MKAIQIEEILVDLEETKDGRQKVKRLAGGAHPMDILGQVLSEANEEYKAANNGTDLIDWGVYDEPGEPGERPHNVAVLYSKEMGDRTPIRKFIMVDRETNRPVQIPIKMLHGEKTMARRDTLEHVGKVLDYEAMKAESKRRGLEIRSSASWNALEKMKRNAEG